MSYDQLDLFTRRVPGAAPSPAEPATLIASDLADDALVSMIATARITDRIALIEEAGRRKLATAVPVFKLVCQRLTGFDGISVAREHAALFEALAAIGGPEAAKVVFEAIARAQVQGPALAAALSAAARTSVVLPVDIALTLLRHDDPAVRADTCRCARLDADVVVVLLDLMDDLNIVVRSAAACALGRMGKPEARSVLIQLLGESPTVELVEAIAGVADDNVIVLLGRLADDRSDLRGTVLETLEDCDLALATKIANRLRSG